MRSRKNSGEVRAATQSLRKSNAPMFWALCQLNEALAAAQTSVAGLDEAQVRPRQAQYGANRLPRAVKRHWMQEFVANFVHLFALLLWAGAVLAWIAQMPELAWAIIAVILINGCFSFWQEYQAERAAEALAALLPQQVLVRRSGKERLVPAADIVPGDILMLTEGAAVAADARVIKTERLRVDNSSLTGESRPVPRRVNAVQLTEATNVSWPNLVFAGTSVTSGCGEAVVFATGAATEFGRIASLTNLQAERPGPLQLELQKVTRLVTMLAVGFGVLFFVVGKSLGGLSFAESFLFGIGIIVANVPEGLLPTLTLSLAMGVRRMARRNALVKRLSAVETLGATTVILTDKTGTLTENQMTVRELWSGGAGYQISGIGYESTGAIQPLDASIHDTPPVTDLLKIAALCCDARVVAAEKGPVQVLGDPTEGAILVAAAKAGMPAEVLAEWPRVTELPFDSVRKRMTTIQRINGAAVACVKGAPSEVFAHCSRLYWQGEAVPFAAAQRQAAEAAHDQLARRGLRVLAVATRKVDPAQHEGNGWQVEEVECDLTLLGLLAMEDPPRPAVPSAIAACRQAGVRVVMMTGDHGLTAAAIGREIGLHHSHPLIVTGAELDKTNDAQLHLLLAQPNVLFARVTPEHKLRLVEMLQQRGEVVAVTGDGVNDAPALKRADIGVAMGVVGTDVAREAADMVLTDDNFASIVAAIEEGRAVYDNIRKFVTYIFASNIPEAIPFIAFILFRIPLPLTVMQILAVDLGTDLVPALALGMEAPESDVMRRPPRSRQERLLNLATLLRAYAWLGMMEAVLSLSGFFFVYWLAGQALTASGNVYVTATTMTLAGIVACQIGNVFACRSERQSVWQRGFTSNRAVLLGIAVEVLLLLALMYVPALATAFGLTGLSWQHWCLLASFGPVLLLLEELRKRFLRARR
ncbi:MAG: cation-transporting P-type ATPase [Blastocatellia bacterium]